MKKGFTLVELLAGIVILSIILIIAAPNIINLIKESRADVYNGNEKILINAARNYMTQKGVTLQDNQTIIVTYQELKENKMLEMLKDISNNNECINSKVYVTKTTSSYIYKPGLVCDNYISLDTFDLIKGYGKFEKDSDGNGLTDMFSAYSATAFSLNNNTQTFKSSYGIYFAKINFAKQVVLGDKYYIYCKAKSPSVTTRFQLEGATGNVTYHSGSNTFERLSGIFQPTTYTGAIILYESTPDLIIETREWYAINLTEIYGENNEPTKEILDILIEKSL